MGVEGSIRWEREGRPAASGKRLVASSAEVYNPHPSVSTNPASGLGFLALGGFSARENLPSIDKNDLLVSMAQLR